MLLILRSHTHTIHVCAKPRENVWCVVDTSSTNELEGKLSMIKGSLSIPACFYIPICGGDVLMVVPLKPWTHLPFMDTKLVASFVVSETSYFV